MITCFLQFVPESPRYLILNGKEEKAKKVLALIAWVNCKQPLSGRLVTQEEKERLLEERNQLSSPADEIAETSLIESEDPSSEMHSDPKDYGTLPNVEENGQVAVDNDIVVMSSDNESDQELLIVSDEHTHRRTLSWKKIISKKAIKEKARSYWQWFLLLFKNGWWRTTLLLWYLWYVNRLVKIYLTYSAVRSMLHKLGSFNITVTYTFAMLCILKKCATACGKFWLPYTVINIT